MVPLTLLNATAEHLAPGAAVHNGRAQVNEREGIPAALADQELSGRIRFVESEIGCGCEQNLENGMGADTAEPISTVVEIRLSAVHQAVPVASRRGVNILADRVGFVQEIVIEPKTSAAGSGHLGISHRMGSEQRFIRKGCKLRSDTFVRRPGTQRRQALFAEQFRNCRAVTARRVAHGGVFLLRASIPEQRQYSRSLDCERKQVDPWIAISYTTTNTRVQRMRRCLSLLALVVGFAIPCARGDDWPQWRGPGRDSVRRETGLPDKFPAEGLRPRWTQAIGGGYGGLAVAGGRVYVMDRQTKPREVERVVCFDAWTGKQRWVHEYAVAYNKMDHGNGPRSTPTVHDGRVYTFGAVGH